MSNLKTADPYLLPLQALKDAITASNQIDGGELSQLLTDSITQAKDTAQKELNSDLYGALTWPIDISSYEAYLQNDFLEWVPQEDDSDNSPWKNDHNNSQEVYDRLCHFYWLVSNQTLQGYKIGSFTFQDWLVQVAESWGSFLDSEQSWTPETEQTFLNDPAYQADRSKSDAQNWKTFNKFFARHLDDKWIPEPPNDNTLITSPASCTWKATYSIDSSGTLKDPAGTAANVILKQTQLINTVQQLLGDNDLAQPFLGGTFVHYFLSPFDYHRFNAPVTGNVIESAPVRGQVTLEVTINQSGDDNAGQFNAPDDTNWSPTNDGQHYEFAQERGILIIDTSDQGNDQNIGSVAVVPVGMAQVSSVKMEATPGQQINQGDEFGYFQFGGSDIIMLFEPHDGLEIEETDANGPIHFDVGQVSVYWNGKTEKP